MAAGAWNQITWEQAKVDSSISSFEHPLFDTSFGKEEFEAVFGSVLEELDGGDESCYVSFFFQRSPVNPSHLVFAGSDEREDFLDWAQEKGCIPSTREVQEGEDKADKDKRKEEEELKRAEEAKKAENIRKQKEAAAAKRAEISEAESVARRIGSMLAGLDKAREKLAKVEEGPKREKAASKVEKSAAKLEEEVTKYKETYPEDIYRLPVALGGEQGADKEDDDKKE